MGILIEKKNGYDVISEADKAKMEEYSRAMRLANLAVKPVCKGAL